MVTTSRQLEINSIAVHPSRPDMVFIGTNNYGVMVSNDGGKSFIRPTVDSAAVCQRDSRRSRNPNRIYASTINTATGGGFFFVSNDNGESWRPSMRSMPSRLITLCDPAGRAMQHVIYLGTNLGVYRSLDRGASWAPVWAVEKKKKPREKLRRAAKRAACKARPSIPMKQLLRPRKRSKRPVIIVGEPDGKAGPATTAALKKFQTDRHLPLPESSMQSLWRAWYRKTGPRSRRKVRLHSADAVNALVHTMDPDDSGTCDSGGDQRAGLYRSWIHERMAEAFLRKFRSAHHVYFHQPEAAGNNLGGNAEPPEC